MAAKTVNDLGMEIDPKDVNGATGEDANLVARGEKCPVCGATRYWNPNLELLINPECYHLLCRNCISQTFKDGPSKCPWLKCDKTLRKTGFRAPYFGNLKVEREVDIRRRVANVFNKVEDDFETLDAYNEYLEMVEVLTEDLVSGRPEAKRKAEAELQSWETQHKAEIERNRKLAKEGDEQRRRRVQLEQEEARRRRQQELAEEAEEKANAARFREEMLDSLQSAESGQASQVMNKVMLKKRGQQKKDAAMDALRGPGLSIRGLRDKSAKFIDTEPEGPYDPYGGVRMLPERVDLSTAEKLGAYWSDTVNGARERPEIQVGGYDTDEYVTRALFEAFSGLGVFIGEEKVDRTISTEGAVRAAQSGITAGAMDVDG